MGKNQSKRGRKFRECGAIVNRGAASAGGSVSLDGWAAGLVNHSGSLDGKKGRLVNRSGSLDDKKGRLVNRSGSLDDKKGRLVNHSGSLDDKKGRLDDKKGDILAHLTCQKGYLTTRTALRTWRGGQLPYPCWLPTAQTYYLQHKKPQHKMPHGLGNKNRDQMSLIN